MAELADAHDSGSCARNGVEAQVLSSAPKARLISEKVYLIDPSVVHSLKVLNIGQGDDPPML